MVFAFWVASNLQTLVQGVHATNRVEFLELGAGLSRTEHEFVTPATTHRSEVFRLGTGLVGTLLAKGLLELGRDFRAVLTDRSAPSWVLENLSRTVRLSGVEEIGRVEVLPLDWGAFHHPASRILDLCGAITEVDTTVAPFSDLMYILGADLFYDPADFPALLCTVSYLLHKFPRATFLSAYHERSSKRSIADALAKWKLKGVVRPWGFGEDELGRWFVKWKRQRDGHASGGSGKDRKGEIDMLDRRKSVSPDQEALHSDVADTTDVTLDQPGHEIAPALASLAMYDSDASSRSSSSARAPSPSDLRGSDASWTTEGDSDSESDDDAYEGDKATFLATFDGLFLLEITLDGVERNDGRRS
ncbi:hypothetical protein M427DRAFT_386922 [Gonapodya prolifera JEL478]|uniref:Uncharacterized protein n=1 Tax=Gonapodya prolifera (strain JEL478) TaxID=1344416 RepID=A0A139A801_GONPJ|nr:hypothetical protein M427DRAFT_386922 [Gonapodya prolifera JEL478]|eukprot:KXS12926.1 hypothetical protein M427DRAFT_386922 [Gonapodya prolifera JEL478]